GVHVKTLYDNVKDGMAKIGHNAAHADTGHDNKWVILDFGDVLVHIFDAQSREYYSIERIWGEKASNAAKFIKEMTGKSKTKKERTKKIEKTAKKRPLFK
ncbi:MAG TPA: RsfS/YbeB/iojap family protein, partial [Candidatus Goldiibacteriota bacterium]|nr:RsfS/YbeB/iojap family protein [Candidatus Goldiibacteriota bacterium]